jgi:hypothetical protein
MAVTRTILPRKKLVQPQHGLTGYEADQDANWALLDANVAFVSDLQFSDLGMDGVVSGFQLGASSTLTPGLTRGVLYSQGKRYAPVVAPGLAAAPSSATSYLFYNAISSFYYQAGAVGATSGDALVGKVASSASAITQVTGSTPIFGYVNVSAAGAGNFTVPHLLGRKPLGAVILMTSSGTLWFQSPVLFDGVNLYLAGSGAGVTAAIQVW